MFDLMTWSFVNETGRLARTASQLTCWPGGTDADCLSTDLGASALIAPFRIDLDLDLSVADGGYAYPLSLSSLPAWSDWSPDWASLSTAYPLIYVYFEGASLRLEAYRTGVGACGFWSDNVFVAGAPNYLRLEAAVTWDAGLSRWVMAFTVKTFSDAERTAGTTVGMLTVGFPDADARALRYLSLGSTYLDAATLTIAHVSFGPAGSNMAPEVDAGADQTITARTRGIAVASLEGTASDDGQPVPPGALTTTWSQVSGPGTATLTNAASRWTRVSFDVVGDYVLRLTATDGELEAHDDVTLTVGPVPPEHAFDPDDDPTGRVHPLLWIEHTRKTGDRRASAMLPLADPSSYYLGWKEPEVLQYGAFHRATSDATGRYETAQITWQVADRDRFWRILAADPAQVDFLNDPVVARAIPDARRRARDLARTVARGFIQRSTPGPTLTYDFVAADWFARLLTVEIPRRRLSRVHFPNLPADADGAGEPVCYGAQSDEGSQFGPVTGLTAAIEAFGSPVTTVALGASGTGGTLGGGLTYGLRVSARGDDDREYDLSDGATATTPTATSQLPRDHAIPPPTGVVCYTTHYFTGSHLPSGFFTKRRYVRMTAIKEVDGVLKESPPSNWTAIEGDLQADSAATIMGRFDPSVTKGRAYFFNLSDFGPIGWDPLLDPNPPIGVEGDTVPLVQYVEVTLAALPDLCPFTAEDQALGWPAGGYDTLESSPAFGKHWIRVVRDTDGTNFVLDAIAASVAGTWDAWAPPAGVALVGYNAYLDLPNGTTRVLELDAGTTAHTFTAEDEGARISGRTYTYAAAAQCSDGQTALSAPVTITTPPKQQLAPILLTCGVLAEALDYRFYRREPGGAYNRRWLVVASSRLTTAGCSGATKTVA